MEKVRRLSFVLGAGLCLLMGTRIAQQIDRTQLPIPDKQYKYSRQGTARCARREIPTDQ